jgi:hypothetical protein
MTSFIFLNFLDLKQLKNYQIYIHTNKIRIQMIEFKFKWTNQKVTPHYHLGGSARLDSNMDVTARSEQAVALLPTHCATSARAGGSTSGAGATARHWN